MRIHGRYPKCDEAQDIYAKNQHLPRAKIIKEKLQKKQLIRCQSLKQQKQNIDPMKKTTNTNSDV